jgi:cytochrome c oxidase subunit IV
VSISFSLSPLATSVVSAAAIPAIVLALSALGLPPEPTFGQPPTPIQLLTQPLLVTLAGAAVGLAVWLGLFGSRCENLSTGRALLIPAIFLPVIALVFFLWLVYVQAYVPPGATAGSVALERLGLLWSLVLPPIAIIAFLVGRTSRRPSRGA